jgi:hypothetical protein
MQMAILRTAVLLCVTAVCACSPYVYTKEITDFGTGVTAVTTSYQTGRQAIDAMVLRQTQASEASARTRLTLSLACNQNFPVAGAGKSPDCVILPLGAKAPPPPTDVQDALAKAAPAFNALKVYVDALTAVTTAADDTALNTASQGMTSALKNLGTAVATVAPKEAAANALIAPAGGVLGQALAICLDQRRYAVLKANVTPPVDNAVAVLGNEIQSALLTIRLAQLGQLGADMRNTAAPVEAAGVGSLSSSKYQADLTALQTKVAAFNLARAADPKATVTAMVTAHNKLMQAVQSGTGQGQAVLDSVEGFATAAGTLKTAVEAASAPPPAAAKKPAASP